MTTAKIGVAAIVRRFIYPLFNFLGHVDPLFGITIQKPRFRLFYTM